MKALCQWHVVTNAGSCRYWAAPESGEAKLCRFHLRRRDHVNQLGNLILAEPGLSRRVLAEWMGFSERQVQVWLADLCDGHGPVVMMAHRYGVRRERGYRYMPLIRVWAEKGDEGIPIGEVDRVKALEQALVAIRDSLEALALPTERQDFRDEIARMWAVAENALRAELKNADA